MKRALVFQHVPFEDLGSFERVLRDHRYELHTVRMGVDPIADLAPEEADLLVVLGGPISVNDQALFSFLQQELAILRARLARDLPCLGVCLGAQLMAAALGARVRAMPRKEIGWSTLDLAGSRDDHPLRALDGVPVLHWHGEEAELPDGARLLASTPACANQAFAWRDHGLALQFHPEVRERELEQWYVGHVVELSAAGVDIHALREQARSAAALLVPAAERMLEQWLAGARD